jgi:hypothetical protein
MRKLRQLNPYNLTPLHEGWGWGLRTLEIVTQTVGLVIVKPLILVYNGLGWVLSKIVP